MTVARMLKSGLAILVVFLRCGTFALLPADEVPINGDATGDHRVALGGESAVRDAGIWKISSETGSTSSLQLGVVISRNPVSFRLQLMNERRQHIRLKDITPECGCLKVSSQVESLAPGQTCELNIRLIPPVMPGEFSKDLLLRDEFDRWVLTVHFSVEPEFSFSIRELIVGQHPSTLEVRLHTESSVIDCRRVRIASTEIAARSVVIGDSQRRHLTAVISLADAASVPSGTANEKLSISVDGQFVQMIRIPVVVTGRPLIAPASVRFLKQGPDWHGRLVASRLDPQFMSKLNGIRTVSLQKGDMAIEGRYEKKAASDRAVVLDAFFKEFPSDWVGDETLMLCFRESDGSVVLSVQARAD